MRIVVLTSNRKGTASYCLPVLLTQTSVVVAMVILNEGVNRRKWPFYKRKLKKIFRIGVLGALNGIRIRRWYQLDRVDNAAIQDIETLCRQHSIPFATTPYLNSATTVELMRAARPDLGLSLGNSYISAKVFSIPVDGMLNVHGEVLPDFQNAQSVIWQLYEGRNETGYTIHKIDKGIDTGNIVKQERFPITFKKSLAETVSANCSLILQRSAKGLAEVINNYSSYQNQHYPQGPGKSYTTPTIWQFLRINKQFRKLKAASTISLNRNQ